MPSQPQVYFIIPAFNEAENLPGLLASLHAWLSARARGGHLVIVDDGSTDETAKVAREFDALPITLVQHPVNLGVHCVFRNGFDAVARLSPASDALIVTLEADNTSSLEILDKMLDRAREGYQLVLASCYAPGGLVVGTTPYRMFLSWGANLILRSIPGMPRVHTFSSFYRVYQASFLKHLLTAYGERLIEMEGFVCVVEILLKSAHLGVTIIEVPMKLDGTQRKGPSKMKTIRTIKGYFRLLMWSLMGRLASPAEEPASEYDPVKTATRPSAQ